MFKMPLHLALSAAITLRKYHYIDQLLSRNIDEQTILPALRYGSEKLIPSMLRYLKHAPRHLHEKIIQRIGALKPESQHHKTTTIKWLFDQPETAYFEVLFLWDNIPGLEKIIDHLLTTEKGLLVLENKLPQWIERLPAHKPIPTWLPKKIKNLNTKSRKLKPLVNRLKTACLEAIFHKQCEVAALMSTPAEIKKMYHELFFYGDEHTEQCLVAGFYKLSKLAPLRDTQGRLRFNFTDKSLKTYIGDPNSFIKKLKKYLTTETLSTAVCQWLNVVLYETSSGSVNYKEDTAFITRFYDALLASALQDNLNIRKRFLNFVDKRKDMIPNARLQKLKQLTEKYDDFDTKYWVERVLEEE